MAEFGLPPSDEAFDFRRQAGTYGTFRRDYSAALYDQIAARAGPGDGRRAVDLGCGTGFVTGSLVRRRWQVVGVDFSAPMLAEAQGLGLSVVRARAEALPVRTGTVRLLTCGTAFHWFAPAAALAEIGRVLAPGGWAALFWRYPRPDARTVALVGEALRAVNPDVPPDVQTYLVHSPEPFAGAGLEPVPPIRLATTLSWRAATFVGYAATVEWYRRLAGPHHAEFLTDLRARLEAVFPGDFEEPNEEYLYLAQRPAT